jgi:hypothetical protein
VAVAAVAPGFANRFAAVTGARSQLTDQPVRPDRPSNLFQPADSEADYGAHGRFDDRARGVLDPHFLRGLPRTGRQLVRAAAATVSASLR